MIVRLRFKSNSIKRVQTLPVAVPEPAPRQAPPDGDPNIVTGKEMAAGLASLLSPVAALCAAMAFWRIGQDMGFAGKFFISDGPFSHWQVWFAAAGCLIAASIWLNRRSRGDDDTPVAS